MTEAMPAAMLAKTWNISRGFNTLHAGETFSACRWRHNFRELGDAAVPTNILFLRMTAARAWRVRGARIEPCARRKNGIGLISQGRDGAWRYRDDVDIYHIYISNKQLAEVSNREGRKSPSALRDNLNLRDPLLSALASEVCQAAERGESGRLYVDTLGLALSMRLLLVHGDGGGRQERASTVGRLAPWQLKVSVEFARDNLARDIRLADLAEVTRLSPFHFARAFKATTGEPPHRHLIHLRMERARALLETTNHPVTEIAARVGYDDPGYLARLFRQHFGTTPGAYRRERRS